jgi:hypothetical protein
MTTPAFDISRVDSTVAPRAHWGPVKEARATAIIADIRRWNERYGEPPALADWEPSRARRLGQEWRAERWEAGDWPSTRMVRNHFGTMSAAIRAANLTPPRAPSRARAHLTSSGVILEAIVAWNARYGEPPTTTDWDPPRARRVGQEWRIGRYYEGDWPSHATVRHHFGTLSKAIVEAGLTPRRPGTRSAARQPGQAGLDPVAAPQQQILALRVRSVGAAARGGESAQLAEALNDLAIAALSWRDEIRGSKAG